MCVALKVSFCSKLYVSINHRKQKQNSRFNATWQLSLQILFPIAHFHILSSVMEHLFHRAQE